VLLLSVVIIAANVISAALFGLIHLYQGPVRVASASVFGLLMAFYYLRFGRIVPLILAHYVTNAIQVIVFVAGARAGYLLSPGRQLPGGPAVRHRDNGFSLYLAGFNRCFASA
jgi:membrane protease YdiL (CAAX protease family)